jgi:hypothetical protein
MMHVEAQMSGIDEDGAIEAIHLGVTRWLNRCAPF